MRHTEYLCGIATMEVEVTIGEWIRRARWEHGMSVQSLSENTGVDRRTISRIESGRSASPRPATILKLCRELEVDPTPALDLILNSKVSE